MTSAIIHVAEFHTTFSHPQSACELQTRLQTHIQQTLLPMIEEVIEKVASEMHITLPSIELELGTLRAEKFESNLSEAFVDQFQEQISNAVRAELTNKRRLESAVDELDESAVSKQQSLALTNWLIGISCLPDTSDRELFQACRNAISKLIGNDPSLMVSVLNARQPLSISDLNRLRNLLSDKSWSAFYAFQLNSLSPGKRKLARQFRSLVTRLNKAGLLHKRLIDPAFESDLLAYTFHGDLQILLNALNQQVISLPVTNSAWPLLAELKSLTQRESIVVRDKQTHWLRELSRALRANDHASIRTLWQTVDGVCYDQLCIYLSHLKGFEQATKTLVKGLSDSQLFILVTGKHTDTRDNLRSLFDTLKKPQYAAGYKNGSERWQPVGRTMFWHSTLKFRFQQKSSLLNQCAYLLYFFTHLAQSRSRQITQELALLSDTVQLHQVGAGTLSLIQSLGSSAPNSDGYRNDESFSTGISDTAFDVEIPDALIKRCLHPNATAILKHLANTLASEKRDFLFTLLQAQHVSEQAIVWLEAHLNHFQIASLINALSGQQALTFLQQSRQWSQQLTSALALSDDMGSVVDVCVLLTHVDRMHSWSDIDRLVTVIDLMSQYLDVSHKAIQQALALPILKFPVLHAGSRQLIGNLVKQNRTGESGLTLIGTPARVEPVMTMNPECLIDALERCPSIAVRGLLANARCFNDRQKILTEIPQPLLNDCLRYAIDELTQTDNEQSDHVLLYNALQEGFACDSAIWNQILVLLSTDPSLRSRSELISLLLRNKTLYPKALKSWLEAAGLQGSLLRSYQKPRVKRDKKRPDSIVLSQLLADFEQVISRGKLAQRGIALLQSICDKAPLSAYRLIYSLVNDYQSVIGMENHRVLASLLQILNTLDQDSSTDSLQCSPDSIISSEALYHIVSTLKAKCPVPESGPVPGAEELPEFIKSALRADVNSDWPKQAAQSPAGKTAMAQKIWEALQAGSVAIRRLLSEGPDLSKEHEAIFALFSNAEIVRLANRHMNISLLKVFLEQLRPLGAGATNAATVEQVCDTMEAVLFVILREGWSDSKTAERIVVSTLIELFLVEKGVMNGGRVVHCLLKNCEAQAPQLSQSFISNKHVVNQRLNQLAVRWKDFIDAVVALEHSESESDDDAFISEANGTAAEESEVSFAVVFNAGLVILSPFLPTLFQRAGLMAENEFKNKQAKALAVNLLQTVVGQSDYLEPDLVLNKLLCGVEPAYPVLIKRDKEPEFDQLIDTMLGAVIQRWKTLGNTSIDGLKETFLQRSGMLVKKTDSWMLEVDEQPYDMLLDTIPWGISTINYSWMDLPIQVKWRS